MSRSGFRWGHAVAAMVVLLVPAGARAVDWLMLQGTEPPEAGIRTWGFMQPAYTRDLSPALTGLTGIFAVNNGRRLAVTTVAPWFDDDRRWHLRRLRLGVRGNLGEARGRSQVNFFAMVETAPNLMTYDPFGDRARLIALDHLSVTVNDLPHARIRAGLFKTPGPEESFQAIHTMDYIEFTDFVSREMIERFASGAARPAGSPTSPALGVPSATAYGINAVRDWGVQVFDSVPRGPWDLSYALMWGRGAAIQEGADPSDRGDIYLYGAAEYRLPGGRGPRANGVKGYCWHQSGERSFASDPARQAYPRGRFGCGAKALGRLFGSGHRQRLAVEWLFGEGMIFLGPAGGVARGALAGGALQYAAETANRSRAVSMDYGFYRDARWQFDIRWDRHDLLYGVAADVNQGNRRVFRTLTYGINYHFSPRARLTLNLIDRHASAPNPYTAVPPGFAAASAAEFNTNIATLVDNVGGRVAVQYTQLF